jgi:uncharacterized protein (TIGR02246 family)
MMHSTSSEWDQFAALREHQQLLASTPSEASLEERVQLLEDERAIHDVLVAYSVHYDAHDLDGVVSVFADDAVLINLRGTFTGADQIRENYAFITDFLPECIHAIMNVTVRRETPTTAKAASYLYSLAVRGRDGMTYGTGGTYVDRLEKRDRSWKIIERRVTGDITHVLTPLGKDYDRFAEDK